MSITTIPTNEPIAIPSDLATSTEANVALRARSDCLMTVVVASQDYGVSSDGPRTT